MLPVLSPSLSPPMRRASVMAPPHHRRPLCSTCSAAWLLLLLLALARPLTALAPSNNINNANSLRSGRSAADELASLSLPVEPSTALTPQDVSVAVFRGLQHNAVPSENTGLRRAFNFCTWECRKAITARQGADTIDRFLEYAPTSPSVMPFINAVEVEVVVPEGGITVTPGTPTRGALSFVRVDAFTSKLEAASPDASLVPTSFQVQLQQQRRPPMQGVWLITAITDVRYAFAGDAGVDTSE